MYTNNGPVVNASESHQREDDKNASEFVLQAIVH